MDDTPTRGIPTLRNKPMEANKRPSHRRKFLFLCLIGVVVFGTEWLLLTTFRSFIVDSLISPFVWHFYYPYIYDPLEWLFPSISRYFTPCGVIILFLMYLLIKYETLVIHECGHLVAARLLRFHFLSAVFGPVKIERRRQIWRLRLIPYPVFAGYVTNIAQDVRHFRRRMVVLYTGGALANLFQGILLTASSFLLSSAHFPTSVLVLRLVTLLAFINFLRLFFPRLHKWGNMTDREAILLLIKGGPAVKRWRAIATLSICVAQGQLPHEWDARLIERAKSLPDGTQQDVRGCFYGYHRALDMGEANEARQLLERMLDARKQVTASCAFSLVLEAAYFEARYHHNAQAARA